MTNRTRIALFLAMLIPAVIAGCPSYEVVEKSADAGAEECPEACATGTTCCDGVCVDTRIDPFNCMNCGKRCPDDAPVCAAGCVPELSGYDAMCTPEVEFCCGNQCCDDGELCCYDLDEHFQCVSASAGSCSL